MKKSLFWQKKLQEASERCPDATACAPLEMWNEKMFCWGNRGAKGIALFDQGSDYLVAPRTEQDTVVYLQAIAVGEEKMMYQTKMQETFREEAKKEKRH